MVPNNHRVCNSPPDTHRSSDVSIEEGCNNNIQLPSSSSSSSSLECRNNNLAGVPRRQSEAADTDPCCNAEQDSSSTQRRATPPDPPSSRSTSNYVSVVASSAESEEQHNNIILIPPPPNNLIPPSSSSKDEPTQRKQIMKIPIVKQKTKANDDATTADGAADVDIEAIVQATNSYVRRPPSGNAPMKMVVLSGAHKHEEGHHDKINVNANKEDGGGDGRRRGRTPNNNNRRTTTTAPRLITNHEYSHSLVNLPSAAVADLLDTMISPAHSIEQESSMNPIMGDDVDAANDDDDEPLPRADDAAVPISRVGDCENAEPDSPAADADADAAVPTPSSPSEDDDDDDDAKEESSSCSASDPPGASHEHTKSITMAMGAPSSQTPVDASANSDEQSAEEIATEIRTSITTPPPRTEEEASTSSSTPTTTAESSRASPLALPDPSHQKPVPSHQKQPSGIHADTTREEEMMVSPASTSTNEELEAVMLNPSSSSTNNDDRHRRRSTAAASEEPSGTMIPPQSIVASPPQPQPKLRPPQRQERFRSPSRITYADSRTPDPTPSHAPGRRSITLRLLEELMMVVPPSVIASPLMSSVKGFVKSETPFRSLRRFRSLNMSGKVLGSIARDDSAAASASASASSSSGTTLNSMPSLDEKAPSPANNNASSGESGTVDRGTISVSWYEGTTSGEMQEHVFNCVLRKLTADNERNTNKGGVGGKVKLEDVRLLDENVTPHGEVVLCPFLPDGSHFLLKFKTSIAQPPPPVEPPSKINHRSTYAGPPYVSRAPESPSAEPSPHPSNVDLYSLGNGNLNMNGITQRPQSVQQVQVLNAVAALLRQQGGGGNANANATNNARGSPPPLLTLPAAAGSAGGLPRPPSIEETASLRGDFPSTPREEKKEEFHTPKLEPAVTAFENKGVVNTTTGLTAMEPISENSTTDQLIEHQLKQLNKLFIQRKSFGGHATPNTTPNNMGTTGNALGAMNGTANAGHHKELTQEDQAHIRALHRDEKKQVIFVIANYLVLFMGFIALSAEIQSRLPSWMNWVQENYDSVQNCATDQGALIECLSNGDFSGLVASFLLWATQSAAAKRIFLFGFDTPKKLWIVVYEALVSAMCWGTSYLFIRRGLNPNTRQQFLHKYWKDAVYGSLAGFNAAFMKAVLKNLIPQEVALEALEGRQLRIFQWVGSLFADEI